MCGKKPVEALDAISEPIKVQLVDLQQQTDWDIWFLVVAVLSLIAAVFIPFAQKIYEERKAKYGFHLYVKKKLGMVWNLLTYDEFEYKQPTSADNMDELSLTFDKLIVRFEKDYERHKNTPHPLFAFGVLFNLQNLLFTVKRVQYALAEIDLKDLDEKTLAYGDKLSKKEHHKLTGIYLLLEHYISITTFHDRFDSLLTIKRTKKNELWTGLKVDGNVLKNQDMIMNDLNFVRENQVSVNEILLASKLLIQELKSYFDYDKLAKKKKKK